MSRHTHLTLWLYYINLSSNSFFYLLGISKYPSHLNSNALCIHTCFTTCILSMPFYILLICVHAPTYTETHTHIFRDGKVTSIWRAREVPLIFITWWSVKRFIRNNVLFFNCSDQGFLWREQRVDINFFWGGVMNNLFIVELFLKKCCDYRIMMP